MPSDSLASNLNRLLRRRATEGPVRPLYTFLHEGEVEAGHLTAAELDARARGIAAALADSCAPGDRVLLLFPPGLDFVAAFFGCLYAGAIAVPAYPPHPRRGAPRLAAIARSARPRSVLTTSGLLSSGSALAAQIPELETAAWLAVETLPPIGPDRDRPDADPDPETPAFLQYTSGSTAAPKGVVVTHGNLMHNLAMVGQAFDQGSDSVVVGWLPLYHDMGLIGNVLQPLFASGRCVLMSPVAFLQRPRRWLEAIDRYRGTTSGGPNFAFDLCVDRIAPEERKGLDLSSWRLAFNGAEPIRGETLERFAAAFAPCGFRREAFYPCYGLAEATLFVSGPRRGESLPARTFDGEALERHEALEVVPGAAGGRRLVGCGDSWCGQRLAVVDPDSAAPLPPGRVGEIWVAGPSVAAAYWNLPDGSAATFGAALGGQPGYLRTGDLGFLAGGELFVTGRLKDLIILRGRNHYPQDLELTVERSHPALRPGCGACVSVEVEGEERLVVLQELERRAADPGATAELAEIIAAVRSAVAREHEVSVHDVVLLRPGGVLKTSSGKVQRRASRSAYLAGGLPVVAHGVLASPVPEEEGASPDEAWERSDPAHDRTPSETLAFLRAAVSRVLSLPRTGIEIDRPLTALGLDSLSAAELQQSVEAGTGRRISLLDLMGGATLEEIAAAISGSVSDADVEALVGAARRDEAPAAIAAPGSTPGPLSYGQRALWFLQTLAPQGAAYNLAAALSTPSPVDAAALRRALEGLVARHAGLRTAFDERDGEPYQTPLAVAPLDFQVESVPDSAAELLAHLRHEAFRPFDLRGGVPLRVRLYELAPDRHVLLLSVHHIAVDYASVAILLRELHRSYLYESGALEPLDLPAVDATYGDFVHWQERQLSGPAALRAWPYWLDRLKGDLPRLSLPTDFPRPPTGSDRGGALAVRLAPQTVGRLRGAGGAAGTTLFSVLLAGFAALLERHSGQSDFVIGTPIAGSGRRRFPDLVGYCVEMLPLRIDLGGRPSVSELLRRSRDGVAGALEHQGLPLPLLAERLHPGRDASGAPLFQAMLVFHRGRPSDGAAAGLAEIALGAGGVRLQLGGMELESLALGEHRAQIDLSLAAAESGDGLLLALQFSRDVFELPTIARMLGHLERLLGGLASEPDRPASELPLFAAAERRQLLEVSQGPALSSGGLLHDLFAAQAAAAPDQEALVTREERLTYGELDRRANRLAFRLRRLGVGADAVVGVQLERSADLVVALLAVLKSGAGYLPLDPSHPGERLSWLLEDAEAEVLVTRTSLVTRLPRRPERLVLLDVEDGPEGTTVEGEPLPAAFPESLAYLIYTSGSTGRPKGVAIAHRNASAFLRWARGVFSDRELEGVLAATSTGFDLSVFELFVPLCWGGRVILADNALSLPSLAAASEVTLVNTVPSAIAELLELDALPHGVTVNLAGEPLPAALVRRLHGKREVFRVLNLYGPSETTTYSTFAVLAREAEGSPSIGSPIAGTRVWLLDRDGEPSPFGVVGEIAIGGAGVARGYHRRPDLTAERFVPDPFSPDPGERLYRTGDLARRRPSGELEFLGRIDHQIKVRGFRLEPGEIEAALGTHPRIARALVLAREAAPGDRRLVAYLTCEGEGPNDEALRAHLAGTLPAPMIPAAFVRLESFPLTPNGKVDRASLPAPEWGGSSQGDGLQPRGALEELLAATWAEVLGLPRVGADDDFFALGGHSLLASRLLARVGSATGVSLPLAELFQAPTPAALARRIGAATGGASVPFGDVPRPARLPLSFAQQRLWFLHQMEPESAAYNVPGGVRLRGPLAVPALAAAIEALIGRHESLRTRFAAEGGEPRQEIEPVGCPLALEWVDLEALSDSELATAQVLAAEAARPFDLRRAPLLRAVLIRRGSEDHVLLLTLHHIVSDGLSLLVLFRELAALYAAALSGRAADLGPAPQYADFVLWQRRVLHKDRLAHLLRYWRERLDGLPPLVLPADRPRTVAVAPAGTCRFALSPDALGRLRQAALDLGVTPFVILLGGVVALLARYSGQEDFAVGTPIASRDREETEGMVGLLVDTLVLRADLSADPSAELLLHRLRDRLLAAHAHQDLPFERLVEDLQPERRLGTTPLFQVMVSHLNTAGTELAFHRLKGEVLEAENGTAKFDLAFQLREERERLSIAIVFRRDLFDATTVERMGRHFGRLLDGIASEPAARVADLPLLDGAEAHQMVREWNPSPTASPSAMADGQTLHQLFLEQARRTPQRPAVVFRDEQLTYAELASRSGVLAARLRKLGVGPEVVVGLCVERSVEAIVGLFAVLRAGGAYLPLDPEYPRDRLSFILDDSGVKVLLTQERLLSRLPESVARTVLLDRIADDGEPIAAYDDAETGAVPGNLAYVIYTSGSTGRPKGTLIEHRSVVHLGDALWHAIYGGLPEALHVSLNASLAFDASVKQIVQLLRGHTLHILPEEVRRDGVRLMDLLRRQPLDVLDCTPSQLSLLVAAGLFERRDVAPSVALVGGEAIGEALWERLAADRRTTFFNVYGPTECTVDTTACTVGGSASSPSLGRPLTGVRVRLLDRGLRAVPLGAAGELCIGGAGVGRGYLGRPALTAERFVPEPDSPQPGARMYRTGDLARHRPDGRLEFLGRSDHQVKIRGARVELGEIEGALERHPAVERAAASLREDTPGDQRLVAYFVGLQEVTDGELRLHLRRELPEALVPSAYVRLEALPLSPHGKVDRSRLPPPTGTLERAFVAPRTPLEAQVAAIWAEVLRVERVGAQDNFFELGGHSLLALQMIARLRQALGVEIPVGALFENPTPEELAAVVARSGPAAEQQPVLKSARRGGRNLGDLLNEVGQLSPEEARRRLVEGEGPKEAS